MMNTDNNKQQSSNYSDWLKKINSNTNLQPTEKTQEALKLMHSVKSYDEFTKKISLETAYIIAKLGYDENTVIAAILMYTPNSLKIKINNNVVLKLVSGISVMETIDKLSNKSSTNKIQVNNISKMIIAIINDPRVLVIKLAEQYCKLTYSMGKELSQLETAKVVMDIYAPLSNKLGIGNLKSELEDAAFKLLSPKEYKIIFKLAKADTNERNRQISIVIRQIEDELKKILLIKYDIYGRAKHIYSIFKKMQKKNIKIEQVYDSIAIRILVPNIDNCYEVLSIVHSLWKNIPEEFDDYIANPKPNGYRSLHTAVFNNKHEFEIQIRTFQMHQEAEYGIAAHWIYKSSAQHLKEEDQKIKWLRNVLEWRDHLSHSNLQNTNIIDNRIYVFTPIGDVIDLPNGSTPIDFAYAIHTDVGHKCKGAKLLDRIVPLNHKLETGDQLKILTNNESNPSRDWLLSSNEYVKTKKAKIKITQWFNQHDVDMLKQLGRANFDRTIKKLCLRNVNLDNIAQNLNYEKTDNFLIAIGRGEIKLNSILQPEIKSIPKNKKTTQEGSLDKVHVNGIGVVISKIAKCCSPNNEDDIIGYISQSMGILIHKINCTNILKKQGIQINKLIHVHWASNSIKNKFFYISISANNTDRTVKKIHSTLLKYNFKIIQFITTEQENNKILINACLTNKNFSENNINEIKTNIMDNKDIISFNSNF